jgi:ribose transport system ATP-binding protein
VVTTPHCWNYDFLETKVTEPFRVEMTNISKSYGGVTALDNVTFRMPPGEIHALIGENGAGKSTLVKILSGAIRKDNGTIIIDGNIVDIKNPHAARKLGIGIIYQELTMVPDLTVAENVFLHHLSNQRGLMNWTQLFYKTDKLIRSIGFDINPRQIVKELSVAYQQVVEITKALSEDVKILILDEPTAVLAPKETARLFDVLQKLRKQQVSIIYISHRLDEIFQIADKITVLKDGQNAGDVSSLETSTDDLIQLMIGRKLSAMFPKRKMTVGEEIFSAKDIKRGQSVNNVSFSLRSGEILGLTGLVGSGRTETLRAIFSADQREKGQIFINHHLQEISSPRQAVQKGIALVPEDRKNQGVILSMSVKDNITMSMINTVSNKIGIFKRNKEKSIVQKLLKNLQIKTAGMETSVEHLSGGNQQKIVLAKWFGKVCKIMMLDEPTRGVDVGTKIEIYELINDLADQGLGIILVSSELGEIIGMCDRALVMKEGRIQGILEKQELTEKNIIKMSI